MTLKRAATILLILNALVVGVALAGTWALFGGMPVPNWDYARLAMMLGIVNALTAILASLLDMGLAQGWRRAFLLLGLCCLIAGGMELIGTSTGYPFGDYRYTDRFGPKIAGLVPYLIPPSWFMMLYPALCMTFLLRVPCRLVSVVAALILTLWDVLMDAAMTTGFAYWQWRQPGDFYDMPYINWLGWLLTGFLVSEVYLRLAPDWRPAPPHLPMALYGVQSAFSLGMALLYMRPWAVCWWAAGILPLLAALYWRSRTRRPVRSWERA